MTSLEKSLIFVLLAVLLYPFVVEILKWVFVGIVLFIEWITSFKVVKR
jgi:hypothetical protein